MHHDLKSLEQRWGLALQTAGFGVWDLDPVHERVHYSPEWTRTLGYDPANADTDTDTETTATWRSRVHPDDLEGMLRALKNHLSGHNPSYESEFRLLGGDGNYRWVLSRGRVVERDALGQALRMVGTLTDLTDRKEAETLRAERDRAEAANRAKNEFLSRMSHELRTPLNAVLGFAQLLAPKLGRGTVEEQRRYVAHIEKAGWHLLSIINDVLDLSRIESGQLDLQIQAVDLRHLLGGVTDMLIPMASETQVSLHLDPAASGLRVLGDPVRLHQVFTNLLSNAVKYNRRGGSVQLLVRLEPVEATAADPRPCAQRCLVTVRDTGLGIPAQQMPHLFEPFNRLGRSDQGVDGVGIGLVLTRWLLDHMDGRITVQSEEGVGTSFTVSLPLSTDPATGLANAARILTA